MQQLLILILLIASSSFILSLTPPSGYTCQENTDITGFSCDIKKVVGGNLSAIAEECNKIHETDHCWGFNTNGYLKRCVRTSCGAKIIGQSVDSCIRIDTPEDEPVPPECPTPPPPPPDPKPEFNCSISANRPDCNCSDIQPPFPAPDKPITLQQDYHYPLTEKEENELMKNTIPTLLSTDGTNRAQFLDPQTLQKFWLTIGGSSYPSNENKWKANKISDSLDSGWILVSIFGEKEDHVVIERLFDEWGVFVYLEANIPTPMRTIRKPIGLLPRIKQPIYDFQNQVDKDYKCKQDIDPTDFLTKAALAVSPGGEEVSIIASISAIEPNADSGLFGNPEEMNKWDLSSSGAVHSWPWGEGKNKNTSLQVFSLSNLNLPSGCVPGKGQPWTNAKMGMMGHYLRAVDQGLWLKSDRSINENWDEADDNVGCGIELAIVSPPLTAENDTSIALLRAGILDTRQHGRSASPPINSYYQITVNQNTSKLISVTDLSNGNAFYDAIFQQDEKWTDNFFKNAAIPSIPYHDRRYSDTAFALLTMYLNLDRGLIPQYGGGKFWNDYNIYLPLDTLALNGALLEWGHVSTSQNYLKYFFDNMINETTGTIIYDIFGCDSDADYGRLIQTFVHAVEYGGDIEWAKEILPIIHAMAKHILDLRDAALPNFPEGSPLHGIVTGAPEHDICGKPGYFFNVNVWHIRGLIDLGRLHKEYPELSIDDEFERKLSPTAYEWQKDLNFAANYTAVRRTDGNGLFFLSTVVGSAYGKDAGTDKGEKLQEGGDEATCIERKTCFASMTAPLPDGSSNQETNYANFRIFSETLLAGVLAPEYELAIMNYRESHRGTLLGMTRFRDVLDDMPILGYGAGDIRHDRTGPFHALLAGHTLNYLTRGTHWGTEQRQHIDWDPSSVDQGRYRNNCGTGGEDCSLCMVSSIASSYWIRWMLVAANDDEPIIYVAKGAPRRWYEKTMETMSTGTTEEKFGIQDAPTRLGSVSFQINAQGDSPRITGWVELKPNSGNTKVYAEKVAVKLRARYDEEIVGNIRVTSGDATLTSWTEQNETALFTLGSTQNFSFEADITVRELSDWSSSTHRIDNSNVKEMVGMREENKVSDDFRQNVDRPEDKNVAEMIPKPEMYNANLNFEIET